MTYMNMSTELSKIKNISSIMVNKFTVCIQTRYSEIIDSSNHFTSYVLLRDYSTYHPKRTHKRYFFNFFYMLHRNKNKETYKIEKQKNKEIKIYVALMYKITCYRSIK